MKYGESCFDILYLLFAVISGILMLKKADRKAEKEMGLAALILGFGDAFHLVPRVLNYFIAADFTAALGIGKLITSITMTVFYLLLYYIWREYDHRGENRTLSVIIWSLSIVRIVLCLFPQNAWLENGNNMTWAIIRNIPFVILGAMVCWLYYDSRKAEPKLRLMWLYIFLSFAFYIPVAVAAGIVPALGMLMLPKTVCYILMIVSFLRVVLGNPARVKAPR